MSYTEKVIRYDLQAKLCSKIFESQSKRDIKINKVKGKTEVKRINKTKVFVESATKFVENPNLKTKWWWILRGTPKAMPVRQNIIINKKQHLLPCGETQK